MNDLVFANTKPEPVYHGPAALDFRGHRIGVEKIAAIVQELIPVFHRHWDEVQPAPGGILIDWSSLLTMEQKGRAILVTARSGELSGYFLGSVHEPIYQSNRQVFSEVGFYVEPWARKVNLGRAILRYVEALARFLEFSRLEMYGLKMADGRSADALYRRAGFNGSAVQYQKELL